MNIHEIVNELKVNAENIKTCKSANYGNIELYNNKPNIEYPYINFDIVSKQVINGLLKRYTLRVYALDRNLNAELAYNKTELLLKTLMNMNELYDYTINYFRLEYKDIVSGGVYSDIIIDEPLEVACIPTFTQDYEINEYGDYITKDLSM